MDTHKLPDEITKDLKREISRASKIGEIPQIPSSLEEWFYNGDGYYYENLESSFNLSDNLMVWNIFETFDSILENIKYELGDQFSQKSKPEIIDLFEFELKDLDPSGGEDPSLHIYPEILDGNTWLLAALVSIGQGGAYPSWIGAFKTSDEIFRYLKAEGFYSLDDKPSRDVIETWYQSKQ